MNILCFHNLDEENSFLSNWYPSVFTKDGITFSTLEQYMMYKKAMCFEDHDMAEEILATADPEKIKACGRKVKNFDNHHWNGVRQIIVYEGLYEKFAQNPELKKQLLATGDALLVECAVRDVVWANGCSMKSESRFDRSKWKGQNLLGYSLMLVREKLRNE